MTKLLYSIWITLAWLLGEVHSWLSSMIRHWTPRFLGFAVVPILLIAWGPVALAFGGAYWVAFKLVARIPLEERMKLWPNV